MNKKSKFYTVLLAVLIIGCAGTTNTKKDIVNTTGNTSDTLRIANDSLEYEILIVEPGFNSWLATQPPMGFYGQVWLENRNIMNVTQYNNRVLNPSKFNPSIYIQQIDYQRTYLISKGIIKSIAFENETYKLITTVLCTLLIGFILLKIIFWLFKKLYNRWEVTQRWQLIAM